MRSVSIRLSDLDGGNKLIPIGFVGENEYTTVKIDCKKVFEQHPNAVPALAVTPPQGDSYPAIVVRDGDIISWTVCDSDLIYEGSGALQLTFVIDGTVIGKTYKARTKILGSIEPSGETPTPIANWLTQAAAALQGLPQEVSNAVVALMGAMVGVGQTLNPGENVTVSYDAENNTLTIGVPRGADGQDGHTPVITAEKVGKVTTFYVDGVAIATVNDGQDGAGIDDTTKSTTSTWSSKKIDDENSSLKTEINSMSTATATDVGKALSPKTVSNGKVTEWKFVSAGGGGGGGSDIDDTAGTGDTDKAWSADKLTTMFTNERVESIIQMENIVDDFSWISGHSYDNSTGDLTATNNVVCCRKVIGTDFFSQFNFVDIGQYNYVSLWNNGVYVGFYSNSNSRYEKPAGTVISKPVYNEWAVNTTAAIAETLHITNNIRTFTGMLSEQFNWTNGYQKYNDGSIAYGANYKHSNKEKTVPFRFGNQDDFLAESTNFVSFWYQGTYVGYWLNGKYYNTSQQQVTSLTYDEWSVNSKTTTLTRYTLTSRVTALENKIASKMAELSLGVLGDSITYGVGATSTAKNFVSLLGKHFASFTNYGVSGCLIADQSGYSHPMCVRYADMSDSLDVVLVFGGTNDYYHGTGWGTADSTDDSTFLGALNVLMSGLQTKYCGKQVFFITPMSSEYNSVNTDDANSIGKTMLDYRNAIIERAAYYSIPVIDLYAESGMDVAHNSAHKTYFSSDGVHPNDAGYQRIYERIYHKLKSMID